MLCNDLADSLNSHRSYHHRRSPIRAFTGSDNNDQNSNDNIRLAHSHIIQAAVISANIAKTKRNYENILLESE